MISSASQVHTAPQTPPDAQPVLRTWHLFLALALAAMLLSWLNNELVMTREVYHTLLGKQLDRDRIDAHFDLMQQMSKWGYLAIPLVLWLRIALVALTVQMVGLLGMVEIPFRSLFRAACWALTGLLYGIALRLIWLTRQGAEAITERTLAMTPGSVAAFVLDADQAGSLTYILLSMLNVGELVWAGILVFCLVRTGRTGWAGATAVTLAAWTLLAFLQGGVAAYLVGVS